MPRALTPPFFALLLVLLTPTSSISAEPPNAEIHRDDLSISVDAEGGQIAAMRLEIFDAASGEPVFDSGLADGPTLRLAPELGGLAEDLKYELRAWDHDGALVFSQAGRLASKGLNEIFSIDFDVVPAGTTFVAGGNPIDLDGDVEVGGTLSASTLQKPGGSAFFGTCSAGSSIRQIQADGSVTCETDDTGGSGDNLGNHQATQTLLMGSQMIQFNTGFGIRSSVGAEIKTGPEGRTFQIRPATSAANTDIAQFRDQSDNAIIRVPQSGSFNFIAGHKMCRVFDNGSNRTDTVMASDGWTVDQCSAYATVVGLNSYQLACLFDDGFSFGPTNSSTPPNRNCGW